MLYELYRLLYEWFSPLRLFRYITVRCAIGLAFSFLLTVLLTPALIRKLQRLNLRQYERKEDAPPLYALHASKEGTPTMGGILIIASVILATAFCGRLDNSLIWIILATVLYMATLGFWDDWRKITSQSSRGLPACAKLAFQTAWAMAVGLTLYRIPETRARFLHLMVPFFKDPVLPDIGLVPALLVVALVIVGTANAVNLTDGLDGLAIGCTGSAALAYLVMAYAAGHAVIARYLHIPYVTGAGELAVFCACLLGASLGFLWYNCHPARVFMGDTGSLALGGGIGMVAVLIKQELALLIVGGVFVLEALSVILQVVSFRLRGRRVFSMAPLHHHFEMKGWTETQVTVRFWILAILCALGGVMTLKIR